MGVKRKSSARVTLVLLGVAALSGCNREPQARRDVYASREDCLADWGNKPQDCTPATDRPRHSTGAYFYGPSYFGSSYAGSSWDRWWGRSSWSGSGARPGSHAVSSASSGGSVSRGGFGSTGRSSAG